MQNHQRNRLGFAVTEFVVIAVVLSAITASLYGVRIGSNPSLGELFLKGLETIYSTTTFVLSLP